MCVCVYVHVVMLHGKPPNIQCAFGTCLCIFACLCVHACVGEQKCVCMSVRLFRLECAYGASRNFSPELSNGHLKIIINLHWKASHASHC